MTRFQARQHRSPAAHRDRPGLASAGAARGAFVWRIDNAEGRPRLRVPSLQREIRAWRGAGRATPRGRGAWSTDTARARPHRPDVAQRPRFPSARHWRKVVGVTCGASCTAFAPPPWWLSVPEHRQYRVAGWSLSRFHRDLLHGDQVCSRPVCLALSAPRPRLRCQGERGMPRLSRRRSCVSRELRRPIDRDQLLAMAPTPMAPERCAEIILRGSRRTAASSVTGHAWLAG